LKILIIENEIYLAQSIATKLGERGHICDMCTSVKDAIETTDYDVVLLSTNINGQDFAPIIDIFKRAIVILMVSYISNDTVTKPLAAGAKDYILKPFMIEELIRKIEHHQDYEYLKITNQAYERYLDYTFENIGLDYDYENIKLPVFLFSNFQKYADAFAFQYAKKRKKALYFVDFKDSLVFEEIKRAPKNCIIYAIEYQMLKKSLKKDFLESIATKEIIISSSDMIDDVDYPVIDLKNQNDFLDTKSVFDQGDILPIEDYVKYIVLNYQNKYPDTELSKKLGISRKSLWEKRKKYDLLKKK